MPKTSTLFTSVLPAESSTASLSHSKFVEVTWRVPNASQPPVQYAFAKTRFGLAACGATSRGICSFAFGDSKEELRAALRKRNPKTKLVEGDSDGLQEQAFAIVDGAPPDKEWPLVLDLIGTGFQRSVWEYLLTLSGGETCTYADIALAIKQPNAAQAVGNAVGANRTAWLIPCHRVLRRDGKLGGYAWGVERKRAMLVAEH